MRKVKTAVIGAGFMGRVHAEGIQRLGIVDIVAVAAITEAEARALGEKIGVDRVTGDWHSIVDDPSIEAVHVCTPNALHYPIAKAAMEKGKHVLCEKPLAISVAQARELVEIARAKKVANCVNHNLRYYPVVQQIRCMRENGDLGEILMVQGTYSQDWLLYDTDYNWRVDAKEGGKLRCTGDIGSHFMDMTEHVTGLRITSLCADMQTFHKTRKRPKVAVETFAGKTLRPEDYEEVPIETDDAATCIIRLGQNARGAFTVNQMAAGCKNRFQIEIFGTKSGVIWNQERPDELWIGHRNSPNQIIVKDPSLLAKGASSYADLPGGHGEGYDDTHKQVYRRFYRSIVDRSAPIEYPTFVDGLRGMQLLDKVLESSTKHAWVDVAAPEFAATA